MNTEYNPEACYEYKIERSAASRPRGLATRSQAATMEVRHLKTMDVVKDWRKSTK